MLRKANPWPYSRGTCYLNGGLMSEDGVFVDVDPTEVSVPVAPSRLWKPAGILSLVAIAMIVVPFLWFLSWSSFGFRSLSYLAGWLVVAGLLAGGGSLSLRRRRAAPWLLLGALVVSLGLYSVTIDLGFVPWPTVLIDDFRENLRLGDAFVAVVVTVFFLGFWLSFAAFVLALVAMIHDLRKGVVTVSPAPAASTLLPVPNADGSIDPGWYASPDGGPSETYWDGEGWSERTRPMTAGTAAAQGDRSGRRSVTASGQPVSPKSRAAAAVLAWFLGILGIHRFYVGKVGTGILMLVTLGGLGIWVLVDFIWILTGTFKDVEGRVLESW